MPGDVLLPQQLADIDSVVVAAAGGLPGFCLARLSAPGGAAAFAVPQLMVRIEGYIQLHLLEYAGVHISYWNDSSGMKATGGQPRGYQLKSNALPAFLIRITASSGHANVR